jgi:phosphonate transport system substrate-binding protein
MESMKIHWEFVEKQDFVIGVLPYGADGVILQDLKPLANYLEFHLQRPVKINVAVDYHSLGKLLELGKINLAWFSHALHENSPASLTWEIVCRPKRENSLGHRGVILVKEASPYHNLQELSGKRIAYVDRLSGSGFIEPARIFRNIGLDPVSSFSEVIFTGNHTKSIDALNADQVDAAAVYRDTPVEASAAIPLPIGLRAVAWTDLIPGDPLVVRENMNGLLKTRLRDLLTNMEKNEKGIDALNHLKARRGFIGFR